MNASNITYDPNLAPYSAFTDLAPLLALFGDELTKQYLATSVRSLDSVLLSIAPVGVPAIIVSAIRVGGHRFMKALVGRSAYTCYLALAPDAKGRRARDSPDDEEKELLSSTSSNVREIWDGHRIVRQTGPAKTTALITDDKAPTGLDITGQSAPSLLRLDQSQRFRLRTVHDSGLSRAKIRDVTPAKALNPPPDKSIFEGAPPNLTLNIPSAMPNPSTVTLFAIISLTLQAAVVAVNALAVYKWGWLRAGKLVAPYGYPLWITGTLSLSVGTLVCSWIVENSCRKFSLCPIHTKDPTDITFFQKPIPEQNIPGYMIKLVRPGGGLQISKRVFPPSLERDELEEDHTFLSISYLSWRQIREGWTICGTVLALCGFILQNIGTRQLHWSGGILQFGITLVMIGLRAWLRRLIGSSSGYEITRLEEGHHICEYIFHRTKRCFYLPVFSELMLNNLSSLERFDHLLGSNTSAINDEIVREGLSSAGALASAVQIHTLLQECEKDADRDRKTATGCYRAMTGILEIIFEGQDNNVDKRLMSLSHFTHMVASDNHSNQTRRLIPIRFLEKVQDRVYLLQAIIALSCYALKPRQPGYGRMIRRIVGSWPSRVAQRSEDLLKAWIGPVDVWLRSSQDDRWGETMLVGTLAGMFLRPEVWQDKSV